MENFFRTLPEGYRAAKVVDAKSGKTEVAFVLFSILLTALPLVPVILLSGGVRNIVEDAGRPSAMFAMAVLMVGMVAYIVLHELVHGAVYKMMTRQRLTFGFTLTVAFCGVPDIYTSRRTALEATAAPFLVFTLILLPLTILLYNVSRLYFLVCGVLFSIHFGGCVGDLYVIGLFLFRFRDPRTLMNDTGPKQTFYIPEQV